jgi:hypothetical protein
MSHPPSATDPNLRFQSILDQALYAYNVTTGKDLPSHPLFCDLTACDSAGAILSVLQRQLPGYGYDQPGTSHGTSTEWLATTVDVVSHVFQTIDAGVIMVSWKMHATGQGQGSDIYYRCILLRG